MFKGLAKIFLTLVILLMAAGRSFILAGALEFPPPQGYLNDFAQVLSEPTRASLEDQLKKLEEETGIEMAVVTVDSLQEATIEDFAVRLFEDWKIGKKGEDNGVLLLVAPGERQVRIEVGYGLEGVLTDGRAGRIIRDEITPAFKKADFDQGVTKGAAAIERVARGEEPVDLGEEGEDGEGGWSFIIFLIVGFIFFQYLASFLGRTKAIWPGAVIGGVGGAILGAVAGSLFRLVISTLGLTIVGLFLDYLLSTNYRQRKKAGLPTSWRHSWGGFSGGGKSSGFGGFGGGGSGGGGASGSW